MITFKEFLAAQPNIDESGIDSLYNKAHIAVELAREYVQRSGNKDLLKNIAIIANLSSGAYGVYNSAENKKALPKSLEQSLIYYGRINKQNLHSIPKKTIKQYYPQVPDDQIKSSDTIHVNIRRILNELPDDTQRIIEISSTILHEAQHEWERDNLGWTDERGPVKLESEFKNWIYNKDGKNVLNQLINKNRGLFQSSQPSMAQLRSPQLPSPNQLNPILPGQH